MIVHIDRRAWASEWHFPSTLRYRPVVRYVCGVIIVIPLNMALKPRHGFGLLSTALTRNSGPEETACCGTCTAVADVLDSVLKDATV
ncbi:hypothetical protein D3C85_1661400 [compost metagenome]